MRGQSKDQLPTGGQSLSPVLGLMAPLCPWDLDTGPWFVPDHVESGGGLRAALGSCLLYAESTFILSQSETYSCYSRLQGVR